MPGSGKTTLLIEWIASQIESGELTAEACTIIMFNVAAKDQFLIRLRRRLPRGKLPQVLTFHSLANRIFQGLVNKGYLPNLTILDQDYKIELIASKAIVSVIGEKQWKVIKESDNYALDTFLQFIEQVKARLSTPDKVFSELKLSSNAFFFIKAYGIFEELMKKGGKMTLTDLVYLPVKACMEDTRLISKISDKRDFIAVDEAQDMNMNQFQLFRIIAGKRARTALIGDNDQTIYSWRGSDPNIMATRYQKQFEGAVLMPLSFTFRYGHELAMLSSALISCNKNRLDTLCFSSPVTRDTPLHIHPTSDEGRVGAELVENLLDKENAKYKDIMVLCSIYASTTSLELSCLSKGIPIHVSGGNTVFKTKEADFIFSLLMMATGEYYACSPKDRASILLPLFKSPSLYLKSEQLNDLTSRLSSMQPFPTLVKDMPRVNSMSSFAEGYVQKRIATISKVLTTHIEANAFHLLNEYLKDVDFFTKLNKETLTEKRVSEISDRMLALLSFIKMRDVSAHSMLKLFNEMRERQCSEGQDAKEAITITTFYQAKGLDCDHIIIPSVNDARYPNEINSDFVFATDIEEERRLLYVGITRAIKSVHLLCPDDPGIKEYLATGRVKKRRNRKRVNRASRFIYEMQPVLVKSIINEPSKTLNHPTLLRYQNRLIETKRTIQRSEDE